MILAEAGVSGRAESHLNESGTMGLATRMKGMKIVARTVVGKEGQASLGEATIEHEVRKEEEEERKRREGGVEE